MLCDTFLGVICSHYNSEISSLSVWLEQESSRPGGTEEPGQHSKCFHFTLCTTHCTLDHQLSLCLRLLNFLWFSLFVISSVSWTPSCSVWVTPPSWETTAWETSIALTSTTTAGLTLLSWKVGRAVKPHVSSIVRNTVDLHGDLPVSMSIFPWLSPCCLDIHEA